MLPIERRSEIIKTIKRERTVKVNELSERFQVTEETIRRDLDKLDKEGVLKKTYGGAVLEDRVSEDLAFKVREKSNLSQKQMIGRCASELIEDGDTIFIDASTTALEVVKQVSDDKNITVITNSMDAILQLGQLPNFKVIGIGGNFNVKTNAFEGAIANRLIDYYYADKTFFSVKGISKERGIMDSREALAEVKEHMVKNSKQAVLVIDESKFDQSALVRIIDMEALDTVVTEFKLNDDWNAFFEKFDIQVIQAKQKTPLEG